MIVFPVQMIGIWKPIRKRISQRNKHGIALPKHIHKNLGVSTSQIINSFYLSNLLNPQFNECCTRARTSEETRKVTASWNLSPSSRSPPWLMSLFIPVGPIPAPRIPVGVAV